MRHLPHRNDAGRHPLSTSYYAGQIVAAVVIFIASIVVGHPLPFALGFAIGAALFLGGRFIYQAKREKTPAS